MTSYSSSYSSSSSSSSEHSSSTEMTQVCLKSLSFNGGGFTTIPILPAPAIVPSISSFLVGASGLILTLLPTANLLATIPILLMGYSGGDTIGWDYLKAKPTTLPAVAPILALTAKTSVAIMMLTIIIALPSIRFGQVVQVAVGALDSLHHRLEVKQRCPHQYHYTINQPRQRRTVS